MLTRVLRIENQLIQTFQRKSMEVGLTGGTEATRPGDPVKDSHGYNEKLRDIHMNKLEQVHPSEQAQAEENEDSEKVEAENQNVTYCDANEFLFPGRRVSETG
jgi:hypothetical protein